MCSVAFSVKNRFVYKILHCRLWGAAKDGRAITRTRFLLFRVFLFSIWCYTYSKKWHIKHVVACRKAKLLHFEQNIYRNSINATLQIIKKIHILNWKFQFWRKIPNLASLHKGKWEENGTITNNRSATVHEHLENPDSWYQTQSGELVKCIAMY